MRRRSKKKHGEQQLGRSRGGFSTKIHIAADALGNSLRFILTGGERNDITQAVDLIDGFAADAVLADKGYDADALIEQLTDSNIQVVIPSKSNRREQREIDRHIYKERHLIENQINKLKQYRRVFSRFEKLARNYLSFVQFAAVLIWLR